MEMLSHSKGEKKSTASEQILVIHDEARNLKCRQDIRLHRSNSLGEFRCSELWINKLVRKWLGVSSSVQLEKVIHALYEILFPLEIRTQLALLPEILFI